MAEFVSLRSEMQRAAVAPGPLIACATLSRPAALPGPILHEAILPYLRDRVHPHVSLHTPVVDVSASSDVSVTPDAQGGDACVTMPDIGPDYAFEFGSEPARASKLDYW